MSSKRHRHSFSALWWHFGPAKRQDCHVHSCMDRECSRVIVGNERNCDGKGQTHWRETLAAIGDTG